MIQGSIWVKVPAHWLMLMLFAVTAFFLPSSYCKSKKLYHLCSTNNISVHINAKKYSFNIEAAYGCKSRDLSIHIDVVGSDCLFFIHFNFFVMPTTNVDSASTVAEIPTQAAITAKQFEVTYLRNQLMSNLASGQREYFRNLWGKAREELSRMQTLHYFGQKKVCHG